MRRVVTPQQWFGLRLGQGSSLSPKREAAYQAEAEQAREFEKLLALHRAEFWHVNLPMRSRAGFPDYMVWGDSWLGFVELKAVSPATGRRGRLSAEQLAFHESLLRAGHRVAVFVLPDDFPEANAWLKERTGRDVEMW